MVNLSTIGHEFTHLVATKISGTGEKKALNESYADIMGKMVERYSLLPHYYVTDGKEINTVSWENSAQLNFGSPQVGLRCFDDPHTFSNPKYYKGKYWDFKTQEEHCNAGVQNYWFYLLCTGGEITPEQGEPVSITAIPRDSAELIAFSSLMYFATKLLDYSTARKNSIHAAEMYFGSNSQEVQSVLRAWYAVGVGTDEWKPGDETSIDNIISTDDVLSIGTTRKLLRDGRIIIVKNGKTYTVSGQQM